MALVGVQKLLCDLFRLLIRDVKGAASICRQILTHLDSMRNRLYTVRNKRGEVVVKEDYSTIWILLQLEFQSMETDDRAFEWSFIRKTLWNQYKWTAKMSLQPPRANRNQTKVGTPRSVAARKSSLCASDIQVSRGTTNPIPITPSSSSPRGQTRGKAKRWRRPTIVSEKEAEVNEKGNLPVRNTERKARQQKKKGRFHGWPFLFPFLDGSPHKDSQANRV